ICCCGCAVCCCCFVSCCSCCSFFLLLCCLCGRRSVLGRIGSFIFIGSCSFWRCLLCCCFFLIRRCRCFCCFRCYFLYRFFCLCYRIRSCFLDCLNGCCGTYLICRTSCHNISGYDGCA